MFLVVVVVVVVVVVMDGKVKGQKRGMMELYVLLGLKCTRTLSIFGLNSLPPPPTPKLKYSENTEYEVKGVTPYCSSHHHHGNLLYSIDIEYIAFHSISML